MNEFSWIERLIEQHKLVRRLTLAWACVLITLVVLRVTTPEALPHVTAAVASVVVAVIGILTTVIGLYQWHRHRDDNKCAEGEEP